MQPEPDARAGVQSGASIDKSPETGLRGLYATADFKKGDAMVSVPLNISMDIGPAFWTHVVWHHPTDVPITSKLYTSHEHMPGSPGIALWQNGCITLRQTCRSLL